MTYCSAQKPPHGEQIMMNLDSSINLLRELSTKSFGSVGVFAQLNLSAWDQLANKQMEIISLATEMGIESLNALTNTSNLQQLGAEQSKIARQFGEQISLKNQEIVAMSTTVGNEISALAQEQPTLLNLNFSNLTQNIL